MSQKHQGSVVVNRKSCAMVFVALAIVASACDKQSVIPSRENIKAATQKTPERSAVPDPIEQLRKLILKDGLGIRERGEREDGYWEYWIDPDSIKYDVRRTDSLVTPLEGLIAFQVRADRNQNGELVVKNDLEYEIVVHYGYQEGEWVPQGDIDFTWHTTLYHKNEKIEEKIDKKSHWLKGDSPVRKLLSGALEKW